MLGQRKKGNVSAPQSAAPEGALPVNQVYPVLAVQYTGLYPLLEAGEQQVDIAQHVVHAPACGPQYHYLGTARGLGL